MTAHALKQLKADVAVLPSLPLKDLDEGEPMCADAGANIYSVNNGARFSIERFSSCHHYVRADGTGHAVVTLLDSFHAL